VHSSAPPLSVSPSPFQGCDSRKGRVVTVTSLYTTASQRTNPNNIYIYSKEDLIIPRKLCLVFNPEQSTRVLSRHPLTLVPPPRPGLLPLVLLSNRLPRAPPPLLPSPRPGLLPDPPQATTWSTPAVDPATLLYLPQLQTA